MNKRKILEEWAKNIDEKDIKNLLQEDDTLEDVPGKLDLKGLNIIKNKENYQKKRTGISDFIKNIIFTDPKRIRYSFSFALSIILIICIASVLIFNMDNFLSLNKNTCIAGSIHGNVYIIEGRKKTYIKENQNIRESQTVITSSDSNINLSIGNNSNIKLMENTSIKISQLSKKNKIENTEIFLNKGLSYYKIDKLAENSIFSVETDNFQVNVIGTEFSVKSDENKNFILNVKKGKVRLKPKLRINKLSELEKTNKAPVYKIKKLIETETILSSGESINVENTDIQNLENKINAIIEPVILEINNNNDSNEKIDKIIQDSKNTFKEIREIKINTITKKINNTIIEETFDKDKQPVEDNNKDATDDDNKDQDINENITEIKKPEITIISPLYKYYEKSPFLNYKIENSDNVKIYLNDNEIKLKNNDPINNLNTGFNKIKITAENQKEKSEKEIEFFINDLNLVDRETFNRRDSSVVGNSWVENEGPGNDRTGGIMNNKLVFTGPVKTPGTYCSLSRKKLSAKDDKLIEIIDIKKMIHVEEGFISVEFGIHIGLEKTSWAIESTIREKDDSRYIFTLKEIKHIPDLEFWIMDEEYPKLDLNNNIRLLFYKNKDNYYSIIFDGANNILSKVSKENYSPRIYKTLQYTDVKITGYIEKPYDKNDTFLELDNHLIYK